MNELLGLLAALTLRLTYLSPQKGVRVPEVDLPPLALHVLDRRDKAEGEKRVA